MKPLPQFLAIARAEFRFGLRRGGPVVPTVLIGLVLDIGILLATLMQVNDFKAAVQYNFYSNPAELQKIQQAGIALPSLADDADSINFEGLFAAWSYFYILSFLLIVSAVAPAIPADRQYGVMELLRSLPVDAGPYLAGKVLGALAAAVTVAVMPLLVYCAIPLLLVGSIPFTLIVRLSLLDGLPVLIATITLGVLTGVPFGRRILAAGAGLLSGILGLAAIVLSSRENPYMGGGFLTPAAAYVLRITDTSGMPLPRVSGSELLIFYGGMGAALILLAGLARSWFHWKENF